MHLSKSEYLKIFTVMILIFLVKRVQENRLKKKENNTLVEWAYQHRNKPIIAKYPKPPTYEQYQSIPALDLSSVTTPIPSVNTHHSWVLTADFIRRSCLFFDSLSIKGEEHQHLLLKKIEALKKNNIWDDHVRKRYAKLNSDHGIDMSHFTSRFTLENMKLAVTVLNIHGYLYDGKSSYLGNEDELFHRDFSTNVLVRTNDHESIMKNSCGVYLFLDTSRKGAIIRAGSTCTSFDQRYKEHTIGAKLQSNKSRKSTLYSRYPHDEVKIDKGLEKVQRGTWSDIKLVFGVRWIKQHREAMVELFHWNDTVLNSLNKNNMKGGLLDKKEKMVSYLFETIVGLCISPLLNVSSNPSYESFNGRFK